MKNGMVKRNRVKIVVTKIFLGCGNKCNMVYLKPCICKKQVYSLLAALVTGIR